MIQTLIQLAFPNNQVSLIVAATTVPLFRIPTPRLANIKNDKKGKTVLFLIKKKIILT